MIPVTQTKVVVRNSSNEMVVRGNCYAACIASIMELPITEVPNVEVLFHMDDSYWAIVTQAWLNSLGWELCTNDDFKIYHDENKYIGRREELDAVCRDKYYLVSGESVRGVKHMCIYQNGKLVHDPHPTKEGLLTQEIFEELYKPSTTPLPKQN